MLFAQKFRQNAPSRKWAFNFFLGKKKSAWSAALSLLSLCRPGQQRENKRIVALSSDEEEEEEEEEETAVKLMTNFPTSHQHVRCVQIIRFVSELISFVWTSMVLHIRKKRVYKKALSSFTVEVEIYSSRLRASCKEFFLMPNFREISYYLVTYYNWAYFHSVY